MATEVLLPASPEEAIAAFGDGSGVTVLGGGTIVMPEITFGRLRPDRVLVLGRAGLAGVRRADGVVRVGATTPVSDLEKGDEPLASVARHVADPEIRAQATVAGNLCAPPANDVHRGDLQAALIALGARVRTVGKTGESVQDVEEFLGVRSADRLVLEIEYDDIERRTGYAGVKRPHGHHYTILCVCCARAAGETRVAVAGAGPHALRSTSVERALAAGEPASMAALKAHDDVSSSVSDDALASAWYRRRVLPTIVARALAGLDEEPA
jgi:aerobic carbon-monoxide dehydrogenase medium subunit